MSRCCSIGWASACGRALRDQLKETLISGWCQIIEKEEVSKALPINQIGMDFYGNWSDLNV
jgi:hypothetical protein